MSDESPDTEEQLTSQDFIKEGPIERGLQSHAEAFMAELTLGMHPEDARAVMTKLGARADMFKAMAFEADKEAKRLQGIVNGLHFELKRVSDERSAYRAAMLDIEGRAKAWCDAHWSEDSKNTNYLAMLAILAVVRRVK